MPVGNVGADMTRGDGDFLPGRYSVGNAFLRGNVSITRRLQVLLSTEVIKNVFLDARALYLNRTGGNMPLQEFWAWVELGLGTKQYVISEIQKFNSLIDQRRVRSTSMVKRLQLTLKSNQLS